MDPQQQQRQDNEYPAGNDIGLTDAEKAALATRDAPAEAAAPAAAPAPAEPAAPAPVAEAPAPVVDEPAAAPAAEAEPPAPAPHGGVFAPDLTPKSDRDFDAEEGEVKAKLVALNQKYRSEAMDDEEYEAEREALNEQRLTIRDDRTKFQTKLELAADTAQQTWAANRDAFLRLPENAVLARSKEHQAMWQPIMQIVVDEAAAEGRAMQDWELLTLSRDRLFQTIGITATPAKAPDQPAKPNRKPPVDTLPPDLSRAPAASVPGGKSSEDLAELPIQDLETYLAGQSDAQRDKLLSSVPGAFVDD